MKKRAWLSTAGCLLAVGFVFVACSDDETTPGGSPTNDGGFNLPDTNTTTTPPDDPDAGDLVDGGGTDDLGDAGFEDDGGLLLDGGDGGVCGPPRGNGTAIDSRCLTRIVRPAGGTIVPGDYDLVSYVLATSDCTRFVSSSVSGRLIVSDAGSGAFRFEERFTRSLRSVVREVRSTPSGALLPITLECGFATDANWSYTATIGGDGKALLALRHTVGTGNIIFGWKQR
jgi:hypothetical protein